MWRFPSEERFGKPTEGTSGWKGWRALNGDRRWQGQQEPRLIQCFQCQQLPLLLSQSCRNRQPSPRVSAEQCVHGPFPRTSSALWHLSPSLCQWTVSQEPTTQTKVYWPYCPNICLRRFCLSTGKMISFLVEKGWNSPLYGKNILKLRQKTPTCIASFPINIS